MDFTKIEGFLKKVKRIKIHACYLGIIPIKNCKRNGRIPTRRPLNLRN
jgi:hypothetical protein